MSNSYPAAMNTNYEFYYGIINEIIALSELLIERTQAAGVFLAKADISIPPVQAKSEYLIYFERYGSPVNGIFDINLLNNIRIEFGIPVPPS